MTQLSEWIESTKLTWSRVSVSGTLSGTSIAFHCGRVICVRRSVHATGGTQSDARTYGTLISNGCDLYASRVRETVVRDI